MPDKNIQKEVKYLNKDFVSFRNSLIEFAKVYYPNTFNDFSVGSPAMMFLEMTSYVGDVLSYYIDEQFKESLLAFAEEKKTVYNMAQSFGYKPMLTSPATVMVDVFSVVPSIGGVDDNRADLRYGPVINGGMRITSTSGIIFRTQEDVNFRFSGSNESMEISVYEIGEDNLPATYLLKKTVKAISGNVKEEFHSFGVAIKYNKIILSQANITEILSVIDSDGNKWYQVPFLAQDTILEETENTAANDPELAQYSQDSPYLLKLLKTPRRFTTFIRTDGRIELRFGAGISDNPDEEIIPNPDNVGSSLPGSPSYLDTAFDPANFLATRTYGQVPSNTILTIKYSYGGGVTSNVAQGSIVNISNISFQTSDITGLSTSQISDAQSSVACTNPEPAIGGMSGESVIEVKTNALAYFQAQNRAVTKADYIIRVYSLPPKYGNIAKVYIVQDDQLAPEGSTRIPNPLALNMYTLGYDANKKLTRLNVAVKENLKTYLGQYRIMTDSVNIKDAYIINIGLQFSIVTQRGYNKNEIVLKCIDKIQTFFNIDKWQINQPIVISNLAYQISLVEGIASVVPPAENNPAGLPILVTNKWEKTSGYSGNVYDIDSATKNGIIYPSMDPSIFELKYPNVDIEGRVIGDL
jgi:hypothetical protein